MSQKLLQAPPGLYVVLVVTRDDQGEVVRRQEAIVPNGLAANAPHEVLDAISSAYMNGKAWGYDAGYDQGRGMA